MKPSASLSDRQRTMAVMTRHRAALASLAAAVALVGGCHGPIDHYAIVVTPHGDSLDRSICLQACQSATDTSRTPRGPRLEPGLSGMIVRAYPDWPLTGWPSGSATEDRPIVASNRFADVPDDIGTRGHYRHWTSPLGEGFFYAERIRGMADPADWVARRFAAADTLADAVADWLRFEMVTQPEWPRVAADLGPELHVIARTVAAVYLVSGGPDSLQSGWLVGLMPEHPLWAVLAIPMLEDSADALSLAPYFAQARADLAHRMRLRSAADQERVLGFLDDGPRILAAYRGWVARAPEPPSTLHDAVERSFGVITDQPQRHDPFVLVDFELRARAEPFSTNGKWIDSLRCVRWQGGCGELSTQGNEIPLVCSAMWSVPDSSAQRRLFGGVVLDEEELYDYANWFAALSSGRQAEWNRMLLALRPGRIGPLTRFRFEDEIPGVDASACARAWIVRAIDVHAPMRPAHKAR